MRLHHDYLCPRWQVKQRLRLSNIFPVCFPIVYRNSNVFAFGLSHFQRRCHRDLVNPQQALLNYRER
jgi:hypothetical protein